MFDFHAPNKKAHYVLKDQQGPGLPKGINCKGPFGKTNLVECVAYESSASYREGESFVMHPRRLNRLYKRPPK